MPDIEVPTLSRSGRDEESGVLFRLGISNGGVCGGTAILQISIVQDNLPLFDGRDTCIGLGTLLETSNQPVFTSLVSELPGFSLAVVT